MRRIVIAICTVAILCSYTVNSIDNNFNASNDENVAHDVESVPPSISNKDTVKIQNNLADDVENVENDVKKNNDDDDDDDTDYGDDDVGNDGEVNELPPISSVVVVAAAPNATDRAGKYVWDDNYLSNLDLNENNYDWNGKHTKFCTKKVKKKFESSIIITNMCHQLALHLIFLVR